MWGATLSRPLLIVGLVRRYRTNYLIRRTPIPYRPRTLVEPPCGSSTSYGIIHSFPWVFPGRGQVAYALLTRAPLAGGPKSPLPSDLHVLGLPLAFILSQDQTLRSKALRPPKGPCFYQQKSSPNNSR